MNVKQSALDEDGNPIEWSKKQATVAWAAAEWNFIARRLFDQAKAVAAKLSIDLSHYVA